MKGDEHGDEFDVTAERATEESRQRTNCSEQEMGAHSHCQRLPGRLLFGGSLR
jgi:hypothetical protein